jgi:glycosyltransferase involved in cell wall biosynthesis
MRVLVVTHYFPEHKSGIVVVAEELARRLAARGADVEWMASVVGPGAGPKGVRRLPVRAWNVTERRLGFPYPLWGPLSLGRLARAVGRADVVHLHDGLYMGNVAAYLLARRLGKPVVATQHIGAIPYSSPLLRGLLGAANRTLARLVLAGADRCVFISPSVQDYFTNLCRFARPPLYLPNGVDAEVFHPVGDEERRALRARLGLAADRRVLLFVGRFVEKKGLRLLHELARSLPEFQWVFVGWGPEDPARWGLPQVRCVGPLPQRDIAAWYRAGDLLVLPSVGEGFPLVVQEAMACGLPAFITSETAGGAPGVETILFCAEPRVEAWAETLRAIDPRDLAARRPLVATFARRWSWDACADSYLQLFEEAIRERRRGAVPAAAAREAHQLLSKTWPSAGLRARFHEYCVMPGDSGRTLPSPSPTSMPLTYSDCSKVGSQAVRLGASCGKGSDG